MDLLLVIVLVLWFSGNFGFAPVHMAFGGGGLIHLLLVLALIIILLRATESSYYRGFWF